MLRKYLQRLNKKSTDTTLINTEFVILDENGNLKGTFQENDIKKALLMLEQNPSYNGYKFQTYELTTKQKM